MMYKIIVEPPVVLCLSLDVNILKRLVLSFWHAISAIINGRNVFCSIWIPGAKPGDDTKKIHRG